MLAVELPGCGRLARMIVDTSALVAIIAGEPEADRLLEAIAGADSVRTSAPTYVECGCVQRPPHRRSCTSRASALATARAASTKSGALAPRVST